MFKIAVAQDVQRAKGLPGQVGCSIFCEFLRWLEFFVIFFVFFVVKLCDGWCSYLLNF